MQPPFTLTTSILHLLTTISEKLGEINAEGFRRPKAELRKSNRIITIQSSLGIEGNTLDTAQVTAILENKRVIAPQKDILEVKNAIAVYKRLSRFRPHELADFLNAYKLLMKGLISQAGKLRSSQVGILKGSQIAHLAPPGALVQGLIKDLFAWIKKDNHPLLIRSCVFHYELEFIHPFQDGNGRMGRLWQTVLLMHFHPVFEFLPVESVVKTRQKEYYKALSLSDKAGNSNIFIEFMLGAIAQSLDEMLAQSRKRPNASERMEIFKQSIQKKSFSRKDYMAQFKDISTATASRDLQGAVGKGILSRKGEKRLAVYRFI
jgi:Fic family protein